MGRKGNTGETKQHRHLVVEWKDKYGKRFGFVRYKRVENIEDMVKKLRDTRMGDKMIYTREAKFERRNPKSTTQQQERRKNPHMEKKNTATHIHRQTEKTNIDLLVDNQTDRGEELQHKFVGELRHFKALAHISNAMIGEGFHEGILDYLGSLWVLISTNSEEEISKLLNNQNMEAWFKNIEKWQDGFAIKDRITWVSIEGILVNHWNSETFVQIGRHWGEVLVTDTCEFKNNNVSQGKVCIKTSKMEMILGTMKIKVNGDLATIRFKEIEGVKFTNTPDEEENRGNQEDLESEGEQTNVNLEEQGEFNEEEREKNVSHDPINSDTTLNNFQENGMNSPNDNQGEQEENDHQTNHNYDNPSQQMPTGGNTDLKKLQSSPRVTRSKTKARLSQADASYQTWRPKLLTSNSSHEEQEIESIKATAQL
ncbi:hypothetical protein LXL04_003751 [Taraxacum kok-saghyz]